MSPTRIPRAIGAVTLFSLFLSCNGDKTTAPTSTVTCSSADQAALTFCPPGNLALGRTGPANAPTITPTNGTSASVTSSSYVVAGATDATTNGYWLLITGNTLRAWGTLAVTSGAFAGDIPLFCGTQTILLTFENASGRAYYASSVTLTGCVVPTFRAQLTWDTDFSDIDLHLVRPGGTLETTNDCYYSNCQISGGLEWGATGTAGNPQLDVDDTYGFGPENIVILSGAETGEYRVVIHNYSGSSLTKPTVKLFFDDVEAMRFTASQTMDSPSRIYWDVARVNIVTKVISTVNTFSAGAP